jgi:hypothetical protein
MDGQPSQSKARLSIHSSTHGTRTAAILSWDGTGHVRKWLPILHHRLAVSTRIGSQVFFGLSIMSASYSRDAEGKALVIPQATAV